MKRINCKTCDVLLTDENKITHRDTKTGRTWQGSYCRSCASKRALENKKRREANGDYVYCSRKFRKYHLLSRYGITEDDFVEILNKQAWNCPICAEEYPEPEEAKREWDVDHCHKTGKVRGILCNHCNRLLGMARDNIFALEQAISYLREHGVEG